jgi:hypothetical protein
MKTSIPGVYAAGDVTGLYATVGRSIGDGIVAGFSAYRYLFNLKFNCEPCLFAYAAQDVKITPGFKDLPRPEKNLRPKLLVSAAGAARLAEEYGAERNGTAVFLNSCTGIKTIAEHLADTTLDENTLFSFIEFLLTKKAIALHL